jgi:hypothetical protein
MAENILREALDIDSAALGANDARTASMGNSLAQVLLARGKYREAETLSLRRLSLARAQ